MKVPEFTFAGRKDVRNGEEKSKIIWLDRGGCRRGEKVKFCLLHPRRHSVYSTTYKFRPHHRAVPVNQ